MDTLETQPPRAPAAQAPSAGPSTLVEAQAAQPARRWYYLDWLRVLAILTVFLYHDAKFFDYDRAGALLDTPQRDWGLTVVARAVELWGMPLFFVIAAIATFFSLAARGNWRFLTERFQRLIIPYLLGVFVLGPLLVYGQRSAAGQFTGSFWQFLPHYFDGWYGFGGNFAWTGFHLWFLFLLFLFSLIMLPLFRYLGSAPSVATALQRFPALRGELFLLVPVVLTAIIEVLVNRQPDGLGLRLFGGWSVFTYVGFFLGGYLLALNAHALASFERNRTITLLLGLGATLIYLVLLLGYGQSTYTIPVSLLRALNAWLWLATLLGFARRYLGGATHWLAEANRAVLPFYILHVPALIVVGMVALSWKIPILANFLLIALISFLLIVGLIEGVVRRVPFLRIAFGMKAR